MIMLWLICLALAMIYFRAFVLFVRALLASFINENEVFSFQKKKKKKRLLGRGVQKVIKVSKWGRCMRFLIRPP
jgi:hypothetical protein